SVLGGQTVSMGGNRVQDVATPVLGTDAANKNYVDALAMQTTSALNSLNDRVNDAFRKIDQNTQGIAIAMAMGGLTMPANKTFAVGVAGGFYDGKQAVATQSALRLNDTLTLNGSVGVSGSQVGGRVGITAAW